MKASFKSRVEEIFGPLFGPAGAGVARYETFVRLERSRRRGRGRGRHGEGLETGFFGKEDLKALESEEGDEDDVEEGRRQGKRKKREEGEVVEERSKGAEEIESDNGDREVLVAEEDEDPEEEARQMREMVGMDETLDFELLLETNAFALATITSATECPYLFERPFIASVAALISESFNRVKILCFCSTARDDLKGAEMHKAGLELLGCTLRLVSKVNQNLTNITTSSFKPTAAGTSEVLQIVKSAMISLQELGTCSANVEWEKLHVTGGKNITILNLTWKSCVAMLSQSEEAHAIIATVVDINDLIALLISHATYSLRQAAEVWLRQPSNPAGISSDLKEEKFRKQCILVKFFFTLATKVCGYYPNQSTTLRIIIVDSILKVAALLFAHSEETSLPKQAIELLSEVAAPAAFGLLPTFFGGSDVDISLKIQFLQCITTEYTTPQAVESLNSDLKKPDTEGLLSVWDKKVGFLTGRVALFLHLLQCSRSYGLEVLLELAKRMEWVLDSMAEEGVYAALMQVQILPTVVSDSARKPLWELMYLWVLRSLETFVAVSVSSREAWMEVEEFLFQFSLHPCALCGELIKHVWCFIAKHSEAVLIQGHISTLVSLLRSVASEEDAQQQVVKRLAQLVCAVVRAAPKAGASQLYSLVFHEDPFATSSSSAVASALLQEGFSLGLVREGSRKSSTVSFLKHCLAGAERLTDSKGGTEETNHQVMWCLLHLLRQSVENKFIDPKNMEEIKKLTLDSITKVPQDSKGGQYLNIHNVNPLLQISYFFLKEKVHPKTLQTLLARMYEFAKSISYNEAKAMKPALADFLVNLSGFDILEKETDPTCQTLWDLYHIVLREQHWALVHAGLASFGSFAEQTPCKELWRFIPSDPGLASDVYGSTDSGHDMFMYALRSFLEKELAVTSLAVTDTEVRLLQEECKKQQGSYFHVLQQRETEEVPVEKTIVVDLDSMDVDRVPIKVTMPSEVKTGILMLQEGFSVLSKRAPTWLSESDKRYEEWQALIAQLAEVNRKLGSL